MNVHLQIYCIAIEEAREGSGIALGRAFLQGHDISFHKSNEEITFTKANCTEEWVHTKLAKMSEEFALRSDR